VSERDLSIAVVAFGDEIISCSVPYFSRLRLRGGLLVLDRSHARTGVLGRAGT
jgi:hypothetical protein